MNKKVAFHTLGCKLNFSESSTVLRQFEQRGWQKAKKGESPDLIFFNTCTVTQSADAKSRKAIRKAARKYPEAFIAVTGCFAQAQADAVAQISGVDAVLGMGEKFNIFKHFSKFEKVSKPTVYKSNISKLSFDSAFSGDDRTRAFLKVQDGCNYACTYCIIPQVRGRSRNKPIAEILDDMETIASEGKKEVILTGVNMGDFGQITGESFFDLLKAIDRQAAVPRVRLSSVEPNLLSPKIIELTKKSDIFMPHFHIPLQSGSGTILKQMKRPYTPELFARRIQDIKTAMPNAFIGVDVITGFPGETDELFCESLNFLKSLDVSFLHVFSYSDRPGTKASQFSGMVSSGEIKTRSHRLRELSRRLHSNFYQQNIEQTGRVLFEWTEKQGKIYGFTENYIKTEMPYSPELPNTIRRLKITGTSSPDTAVGELL